VAIFCVHVADLKEVLSTTEAVMVEFVPQGHGRQTWPRVPDKWMHREAIGVEEDDIQSKGGKDGR